MVDMKINIKLYREVADLYNQVKIPYRYSLNDLSTKIIHRDVDISRLYHVLNMLKSVDKVNYITVSSEAVKTILSIQISEGDPIIVRDEFYNTDVKGEASSYIEGGFPDYIVKGRRVLRGGAPSIISTVSALEMLIDYSTETQYWDEELDDAIRMGYRYLRLRDLNKDGLLEQDPSEDWIPLLRRGGAALSSNAMYLKLLEDLYYLYLDKDRKFSDEIKRVYLRLYNEIERMFWMDGYYADYINQAFNIFLRATIDTSLIGRPLISRDMDKISKHLNRLYARLVRNGHIYATEDRVRISPEYRLRGYVSSTFHSILFVYDTLTNGLLDISLESLKCILPSMDYSYIVIGGDGWVKRVKEKGPYNKILLHLLHKKIEDVAKGGGSISWPESQLI